MSYGNKIEMAYEVTRAPRLLSLLRCCVVD
jgi:hypothetical protein